MRLSRRELLRLIPLAVAMGIPERILASEDKIAEALYQAPGFGNLRLLHITDTHAQLLPVHYREPNVNIGIGAELGQPPHLVGEALLDYFKLPPDGRRAHAFTYLDYTDAARRYGRMGGYAHIKTLVDRLRAEVKSGASLLLDGGDTWQGSATALWNQGADMVEASNLLGVDCMTGHWEFTYPEAAIRRNIAAFKGEFLAQNVFLSDTAIFNDVPAFDAASGRVFNPCSIKTLGGRRVAIIGQAFPHVHVAHPVRFTPDWTFGLHERKLQELVATLRNKEKPDLIVLLSHNGMDTDLKMASRVSGIDIIFGGHTHDAVPAPTLVSNPGGKTLVTNAGTNGKFVGVMDLDVGAQGLRGWRYRLLPVYAALLPADNNMAEWIRHSRAPHLAQLDHKLATTEDLLYRRGNFNGSMDQMLCDAQREVLDAEIALSPGFRWGTSVLPGTDFRFEDLMQQTALTYPETYVREMTGAQLKALMEDVCDNLFNPDAYYQQGGDMVRTGGLRYRCDPTATLGRRIDHMTLDNGKSLDAQRKYKVAGWAAVQPQVSGKPIWEVATEYLQHHQTLHITHLNQPQLKNVASNPGVADYGRILI